MENQLPRIGSLYKHSRSAKLYRVLGLAKHSESLEDLVVYEAQYDNEVSKLWVRPLSMFLENVTVEGRIVPRFVLQSI